MPSSPPEVLRSLASATDANAQERAWAEFLASHSDIILHVARAMGGDHDAIMDRYAFALDALRRDECRRLRVYLSDGRGSFTTWLAVVVRRLCLDEYRRRYGRAQADSVTATEQRASRRNLTDLIGAELGVEALETSAEQSPDAVLRRRELRRALEGALGELDPADRLLLRMRFEDDLSVPDIARLLNKGSPFRLYRRLDKVLVVVRKSLEAVGIRDSAP
jgi:RNA polymerase sigma factor (sigma-70 family)